MLVFNKTANKYFWRGAEISEQEYLKIRDIISTRPTPPVGYDYRLTDALAWELVELPPEPQEELSDEELGRMVREGLYEP